MFFQSNFGLNTCGEGGEYETLTLDCPIFKKKLVVLVILLIYVVHFNFLSCHIALFYCTVYSKSVALQLFTVSDQFLF